MHEYSERSREDPAENYFLFSSNTAVCRRRARIRMDIYALLLSLAQSHDREHDLENIFSFKVAESVIEMEVRESWKEVLAHAVYIFTAGCPCGRGCVAWYARAFAASVFLTDCTNGLVALYSVYLSSDENFFFYFILYLILGHRFFRHAALSLAFIETWAWLVVLLYMKYCDNK